MKKGKWFGWLLFTAAAFTAVGAVVQRSSWSGLTASMKEQLLNMQNMLPSMQGITAKLQDILPSVQGITAKLQSTLPSMQDVTAKLQGALPNVQGAVGKAQDTIASIPSQAMSSVPQLQGHWHMPYIGLHSFLVQAAILVGGWLLAKTAANKAMKWLGAGLMIWGAALLLPKVLFIPFILIVAYFTYKIARNGNASKASVGADASAFHSHTAAYLDQWEKQHS